MVPYKFYILLKKKKITSWSASLDLLLTSLWHPKWGFTVVFLSLQPLICHFSANSFCPCPVSWLPLSSPLPGAASPRCPAAAGSRSTAVGTRSALLSVSCSRRACCWPCAATARRAPLLLCQQMPLLSPEVLGWKLSLWEARQSHAQRRTGYLGDRYRMQTSAVIDTVQSLSASNWKTTPFLAELSLDSFSVSL